MKTIIKKYVNPIIPLYAIIPLVFCFVFNCTIYNVIGHLMANVPHYDFTTRWDNMVPFVPAWSFVYISCFLFWGIGYIVIGRQSREHCFRFVTAELLSKVICGLFFLFLPTTNIRPEIVGNGFSEMLTSFIYSFDEPVNLFPSIHCLISWFCYIGVRGEKNIPKWYRIFAFIFAILVCASTQLLKQHYLIDVAGGILLAEITYWLSMRYNWYKGIMKIFQRLNAFVWGKENV